MGGGYPRAGGNNNRGSIVSGRRGTSRTVPTWHTRHTAHGVLYPFPCRTAREHIRAEGEVMTTGVTNTTLVQLARRARRSPWVRHVAGHSLSGASVCSTPSVSPSSMATHAPGRMRAPAKRTSLPTPVHRKDWVGGQTGAAQLRAPLATAAAARGHQHGPHRSFADDRQRRCRARRGGGTGAIASSGEQRQGKHTTDQGPSLGPAQTSHQESAPPTRRWRRRAARIMAAAQGGSKRTARVPSATGRRRPLERGWHRRPARAATAAPTRGRGGRLCGQPPIFVYLIIRGKA